MSELVDVWEFPRSFASAGIAQVAEARLTPPDLRARVLSSRGDVLTLQVIEGGWTQQADLLLYVRERGAYEVLRREDWPGGRVLLTLRAWTEGG